jgi:16S rRNA (cytidine1402-2'-O)-methyltransferase
MSSLPNTTQATLFVVATPIGNLSDLTERARQVLSQADLIACEDTRHTVKLLQHLGIHKPTLSVHDHNERERIAQIRSSLVNGKQVALVSDAGTPLISDPGYLLVQALRSEGFPVVPVPGPCAMVAALSGAGLPTDRFCFEGFLPHKSGARKERLEGLEQEPRTLVFYESRHRILDSLADMALIFGNDRPVTLARELTKTFETWYSGSFAEVREALASHEDHQKGEFVVVVGGHPDPSSASHLNEDKLFRLLLNELPPKKAAAVISDLTGESKKVLYQKALELQGKI